MPINILVSNEYANAVKKVNSFTYIHWMLFKINVSIFYSHILLEPDLQNVKFNYG